MKHTWKYNQGYRWYVYLGPGKIEYFFDYDAAKKYSDENGGDPEELF